MRRVCCLNGELSGQEIRLESQLCLYLLMELSPLEYQDFHLWYHSGSHMVGELGTQKGQFLKLLQYGA